MLPFPIRLLDGLPASDQIVLAVRRAVLTGQLQDGDEFPSVRGLSQELRISPTTAHKAIGQLRDAGLLASRPGVGMVVRTAAAPDADARLALLAPEIEALVRKAAALHVKPKALAEMIRDALSKAAGED
ncbi:MAG TPA: GntR family transcriptional regulator [Verrucomicrobiales bacterium]|jgi:DNA-binding transcriptional regulator YhcF (GntR family)|nr:GntR family transcriptional regulator [Verrucomicrobiales bacterium]